MRVKSLLRNEDGSVIVLALVMLVLLTIIGMSASSTSTIEVQIAGNVARSKKNFYLAEAVAMEATQMVAEASAADLDLNTTNWADWLYPDKDVDGNIIDLRDPDVMIANGKVSTIDPNARYAAVIHGVAAGSSLDMAAASQLYEIDVVGIYSGNGQSHLAVGFRKRF